MTTTPLSVGTRPFAIEPVTNIMLPDGIFDTALGRLRIACHFTNTSGDALTNVRCYLESVGDPGIVATAHTAIFAMIPARATVLVTWDADFTNADPGKRLVSFVAAADGFDSRRSIQTLFVSQTRYQSSTNSYTCTVEEGTLTVSKIRVIGPRATWGKPSGRGHERCLCPPQIGPWIPKGMTLVWTPNPAYAGVHGDLPFSDPWWKVLAWIVAAVAAIVAIIAAIEGQGTASVAVGGTFEETDPSINCCQPDPNATEATVAGVASAIATAAVIVGLSDAADPFWRGQEATAPAAGESTVGERLVANWTLPSAPNAGKAYDVNVQWDYTRFTDAGQYGHSVAETQTNIHVCDGVEVETPATVHAFAPLWVRARFHRGGADLFRGADLYAFALFRAPGGLYFVVPLTDDGLGVDPAANDGVYAGTLDLERAYRRLLQSEGDIRGTWRVYVYAQDVNLTKPGTPPHIAAQTIGGFVVASALTITFDPTLPCPLSAQGAITVI